MRLGGEVDDGVRPRHQRVDEPGVADVADDELDARFGQIGQRLAVAGVGQLVEDGDRVIGRRQEMAHVVAADEPGAAGDQIVTHGRLA